MPVYNVEPYLRECLDSVLAQTRPSLEILIVDDGSTDGSGEICDEYARRDGRVCVFHTENNGLSCARNFALDRARGAYLAFLDSDDRMEPGALETLAAAAARYGADVAAGGVRAFWINRSAEIGTGGPPAVFEGEALAEQVVTMSRLLYAAWNKLYRAELFEGIRFPAGRIYEDVATVYRVLLRAERAVLVPEPLFDYRKRRGSLSHAHSAKNLADSWFAFHTKYNELTAAGFPVSAYPALLSNCLFAAERMWAFYDGLPAEGKRTLTGPMDEVQAFARAHGKEALRCRRISRKLRLLSPVLRVRSGAVFRLLNRAARRGAWFADDRREKPGDVLFP